MELKLNIYSAEKKNEVEKTYVADSYDLMLGTAEDIMEIVDIDKLDDKVEVGKMIVRGYSLLKPFLLDIFEGLTEDELRRVKMKELVPLFIDIIKGIIDSLGLLKKSGN